MECRKDDVVLYELMPCDGPANGAHREVMSAMTDMVQKAIGGLAAGSERTRGSQRVSWLDVTAVYMLIFVSGTLRFNAAQQEFLLLALAFSSFLLLWKTKRVSPRFIIYLLGFFAGLGTISLYTDGSLELSSVFSTTIKLFVAYAVLAFLRERFVDVFLRVILFLALVSLLGYVVDKYSLFDSVVRALPPVAGGLAYEGFLYSFRYDVQIGRNSSIFYEPGAFQLYLNAALFIILFAKCHWPIKQRFKYVAVFLAAIITTFSTAAFLMTGLIIVAALFKRRLFTARQKGAILLSVLVVVLVFGAQFHEAVIVKLDDYMRVESLTDKSNQRSQDVLVDLEIVKHNVLGVGYLEYYKMFSVLAQVPEEHAGSSNGITRLCAVYGLPFSLLLLASYARFFVKFFGISSVALVGIILLLMLFWSQSYFLFAPICLTLIAAQFVWSRPLPGTTPVAQVRGYGL